MDFKGRIVFRILLHQLEVIVAEGSLGALRSHASELIHVRLLLQRFHALTVLISAVIAAILVAKHRLDGNAILLSNVHLVLASLGQFLRVAVRIFVLPAAVLNVRSIGLSLWRGGQNVFSVLLLRIEAAVDELIHCLVMHHQTNSTGWHHVVLLPLHSVVHQRCVMDPVTLENVGEARVVALVAPVSEVDLLLTVRDVVATVLHWSVDQRVRLHLRLIVLEDALRGWQCIHTKAWVYCCTSKS